MQISAQRAHTLRHVEGMEPVELTTLLVTWVDALLACPTLDARDDPVSAD